MSDKAKPDAVTTTTESAQGNAVPFSLEQVIAATVQAVERQRPVSPFDLTTFDDIVQFSQHMAKSGLCPKDFQRKPDDIISAVLWGKELGLPAMASLQSMAVINGRPSLWGDAVPGLCYRTGQVQDVVERFDGEADSDDYTAVCIVTRRGQTPREGRFSAGDVRRAGLKSVHLQYPKDMMMWRARHRAWHGAFPDTLKGLGTAELEQEQIAADAAAMPRPERSWFTPRFAAKDGWDVTWFNGVMERLLQANDRQTWLVTLAAALKEAPTLRDVDELDNLPQTQSIVGTLPDDWKARVEAVFGEARQRFMQQAAVLPSAADPPPTAETTAPPDDEPTPPAPPGSPAPRGKGTRRRTAAPPAETPPAETAPQPTQTAATAAFDHYLLDEAGEMIGEQPHRDPAAWARAYAAIYGASRSPEALREHNADALRDAMAHPGASFVLEAIEETPEGIAVIQPHVDRSGTPDWRQWLTDLKAAAAAVERWQLPEWIEAHRAVIDSAPQSARLLAIKTIVTRCKELDVPPPTGFAANGNGHDRDQRIADTILEYLDTLADEHAIADYRGQGTVTAPLARWRTERPELHTTILSAFAGRIEQVKAERGG